MIDARELRIGNIATKWAKSPYGIARQVRRPFALGIDDIVKCANGTAIYKGIPLTEEILLKCGFEKAKTDDIYEYDVYSIQIENSRSLCYYQCPVKQGDTGIVAIKDTWFFDYQWNHCATNDGDTFWNQPKYLHQLQNLYWCLCGKELEFNP